MQNYTEKEVAMIYGPLMRPTSSHLNNIMYLQIATIKCYQMLCQSCFNVSKTENYKWAWSFVSWKSGMEWTLHLWFSVKQMGNGSAYFWVMAEAKYN